jgi:hypothetical protein
VSPVHDVEAVRPLDHGDGRQRAALAVGARDALPARRQPVRGRPEAAVEVAGGVDGADDLLDRDRPQPRRAPGERGDVAEVPRPGRARAAGEAPDRARGAVGTARAQEVRAHRHRDRELLHAAKPATGSPFVQIIVLSAI